MNKKILRAFILSSFVFIVCSSILFFYAQNHADVDTPGYDALAQNFARKSSLLSPHNAAKPPIQPIGFPLLLGLLYKVFGYHHTIVILFQLLISLFCAWLLVKIAQKYFDEKTAFFVALLWPISLGFLIYSQVILAEIFHTFLVIVFIYYFLSFLQTRNVHSLLYATFFIGISLVFKSTMLLFFIPLLLFILLKLKQALTKKIRTVFLVSALFFLPMFVHSVRNYIHYDVFAFTPIAQVNLYQVFLAKIMARAHYKKPQEIIENQLCCTETNLLKSSGWQSARTLFFQYIKKYPKTVLFLWIKNCSKTAFGLFSTQLKLLFNNYLRGGAHSFFAQKGSFIRRLKCYLGDDRSSILFYVSLYELLLLLVRYIFLCIALINLGIKKQWYKFCFFISFIAVCVMVTGVDGCARYRMAFEPLFILLSMGGLSIVYQCLNNTFFNKRMMKQSGAVV